MTSEIFILNIETIFLQENIDSVKNFFKKILSKKDILLKKSDSF